MSDEPAADAPDALDVYWRPGCMFCASLKRSLRRRNIAVRLHDIWSDPDAAATVRAAAGGNETVPTVVIAGRSLVNPTATQVEQLLGEVAPQLLADVPPRPRWKFWG